MCCDGLIGNRPEEGEARFVGRGARAVASQKVPSLGKIYRVLRLSGR
jgi:hypothetical protein